MAVYDIRGRENSTIWGSILGVSYLRSMRKASVLRASDGANLSTPSAKEMELQNATFLLIALPQAQILRADASSRTCRPRRPQHHYM